MLRRPPLFLKAVSLLLTGLLACIAPGCGEAPADPASDVSVTDAAARGEPGATPASASAPTPASGSAASAAAGTPTTPAAPPAAAAADGALIEERSGLTSSGDFVVTWAPVPDPIPFNEPFKLSVTVARAATPDKPEPGARLELDATMPDHGHGMNRTPRVQGTGDGTFLVEGMLFHMSGEWHIVFHVYLGSEYGQAILRVQLP